MASHSTSNTDANCQTNILPTEPIATRGEVSVVTLEDRDLGSHYRGSRQPFHNQAKTSTRRTQQPAPDFEETQDEEVATLMPKRMYPSAQHHLRYSARGTPITTVSQAKPSLNALHNFLGANSKGSRASEKKGWALGWFARRLNSTTSISSPPIHLTHAPRT